MKIVISFLTFVFLSAQVLALANIKDSVTYEGTVLITQPPPSDSTKTPDPSQPPTPAPTAPSNFVNLGNGNKIWLGEALFSNVKNISNSMKLADNSTPPNSPTQPTPPDQSAPPEQTITYPVTVGVIERMTVTAIDATSSNYTVSDVLYTPDGNENDSTETIPVAQIQSRADIQTLLASCEAQGGQKQTITVSGGTFDTCFVDLGNGNKIWLGDVPLNIVKKISIDDNKDVITEEVVLYSFGK